jgi:16S rRNA processing protein RimM
MGERAEALIAVGRFTKPHGVQGELVFLPYVYDLTLLPDLTNQQVCLQHPPAPAQERTVLAWRTAHRRVLIRLGGCTTMSEAAALRDYEVLIPRRWFPPLPAGEYYWFEIEGLAVYASDGRYVGTVAEIIYTGSNDVYVVRDGGREVLVPALKDVVRSIDLERGEVLLSPEDGRFEL